MISEFNAIRLLDKYFSDKRAFDVVLKHSFAVRDAALDIASKINDNSKVLVDVDLVRIGALLHDIGRSKYPPGPGSILHGLEGYNILVGEGLYSLALFARNHVGFGIYDYDIRLQHLPLPDGNYVPETIEQKIVSYADNLIFGSRRGDFSEVLKRFFNEVSFFILKRSIDFHNEIAFFSGMRKIVPDLRFILSLFDPLRIVKRINSSEYVLRYLPLDRDFLSVCFNGINVIIEFYNKSVVSISFGKRKCDLFLNDEDVMFMYENSKLFLKDWESFYKWLSEKGLSEKAQRMIRPFFDDATLFL